VCTYTSGGGYFRAMRVLTRSEALRRMVERTDLDEFANRVLDSFWERPEFQALHPPREEVRALVRWNLDLVIRWLIQGRGPTERELEVFREQARAPPMASLPTSSRPTSGWVRGSRGGR
jgi:hypothetical protein